MLHRNVTPELRDALADTPVVLLNGARQTGKSTLARALAPDAFPDGPAAYVTLDDATALAAATADPDGFVRGLDGPVILDEVQRAPELFRAVKAEVDRDRRPGRFLLTGSADVLLLPVASESLAGRMEVVTLWPLSQGEIEGRTERFVDVAFEDALPPAPEASGGSVWARLARGGYPEAAEREDARRRSRWFGSYVTTILQRDVRDLARIEGLSEMPRLLALVGARTATLLNVAELSRSSGLPASTLKRYLTLLQATFLVREFPAWSTNRSKRLVKSPKLLVADSGLAAHLVGFEAEGAASALVELPGLLLETFVIGELVKQAGWSRRRVTLHHYRTQDGREVDAVLEDASGRVAGVEVKASGSVSAKDFGGLRALRDERPEAFHRGVVLYTGPDVVPFGDDLAAVPMSALWEW
ncbi:ATP-binding protein [Rubrivirga sp. S365]|uniref:ATP-binding protein n=1 Tax=Rubrivirga sp. S365 TaxID=3076080 RepID=UPI0028C7E1E3|nr:ATP-binding protein [Rubrivirga sp. S365]MDT7858411.1 ATP-binding protein [Rubrivirga sp. S365]